MSNVLSIVAIVILVIVFNLFVSQRYLGKARGAELSRRQTTVYRILGAVLLVLGFLSALAVKFDPNLKKTATLFIAIAFVFIFQGTTYLGFAKVYRVISDIQEKLHIYQ